MDEIMWRLEVKTQSVRNCWRRSATSDSSSRKKNVSSIGRDFRRSRYSSVRALSSLSLGFGSFSFMGSDGSLSGVRHERHYKRG